MARASYPAANEFIAAYEGSQVPKVTWDRTGPKESLVC